MSLNRRQLSRRQPDPAAGFDRGEGDETDLLSLLRN